MDRITDDRKSFFQVSKPNGIERLTLAAAACSTCLLIRHEIAAGYSGFRNDDFFENRTSNVLNRTSATNASGSQWQVRRIQT